MDKKINSYIILIVIAKPILTFVLSAIAGSAPHRENQSDGDSPTARRESRGQKIKCDRFVSKNRLDVRHTKKLPKSIFWQFRGN